MNAPFHPETLGLDQLEVGTKGRILLIDPSALDAAEFCRLAHFGFDEGALVEPLHVGPFGRDPLAVRIGRMTVAIRRKHAAAVRIIPLPK